MIVLFTVDIEGDKGREREGREGLDESRLEKERYLIYRQTEGREDSFNLISFPLLDDRI